jgi:hypothetical protein
MHEHEVLGFILFIILVEYPYVATGHHIRMYESVF